MAKSKRSNVWSISLIVPKESLDRKPQSAPDPSVSEHSTGSALRGWLHGDHEIVTIDGKKMQKEWDETMVSILSLANSSDGKLDAWQIDEITAGLTLSAKGKLLFIAEAGVQASVTVKLKRSTKTSKK